MNRTEDVVGDLVAANQILGALGVLDGFGHVSVRHPARPDRYLLSRSLAPELVTAEDIMTFDLASIAQEDDLRAPYLERFIHGAIYARRSDVHAVVHSHAASVVPFSVSSVHLRAIAHTSAFLRRGAPVFDIRRRSGITDMLIRDPDQGEALAAAIGDQAVVLMRGHGIRSSNGPLKRSNWAEPRCSSSAQ